MVRQTRRSDRVGPGSSPDVPESGNEPIAPESLRAVIDSKEIVVRGRREL